MTTKRIRDLETVLLLLKAADSLDKLFDAALPTAQTEDYMLALNVGDYDEDGGEVIASIRVDIKTGRHIIAAAERIIRERLAELGETVEKK